MVINLIFCNSSAAAEAVVNEVKAGELWGVSIAAGRAASEDRFALVECSQAEADAIADACPDPENLELCAVNNDPEPFSHADGNEKLWFLRGRL